MGVLWKINLMKKYEWNKLTELFEEFGPELVKMQDDIREHDIVKITIRYKVN